jgi:hypothetical protein
MSGKGRVGTEYLDGFESSEPYNLQAAFLKFCYLCVRASIDDEIGHDIVGLKVIKGDDHPPRRGGGGRRDRGEGSDG